MATLTALPREVLKWLLSLELSCPVRNIKRDFSNGFLFAEVLSRYFPADVGMHMVENSTSTERKRANWVVLEKLFKKRGIPVQQHQVDAVVAAEGEAASEMLQLLYTWINSEAYTQSLEPSLEADPAADTADAEGYGALTEEQAAAMAAWQQQLWYQQQLELAEQMTPTSKKRHLEATHQQLAAAGITAPLPPASSVSDELAFSRKPRAVAYRPYDLKDYEQRFYDVKGSPGYWQLGRLGPANENADLQAKRERVERIKQLSREINATNQQRLSSASGGSGGSAGSANGLPYGASSLPRGSTGAGSLVSSAAAATSSLPPPAVRFGRRPKEPSARERAVEYARTSVPRPEPARKKPQSPSAGRGSSGGGSRQAVPAAKEGLDKLQQQHDADARAVDAIAKELERSLGLSPSEGAAAHCAARSHPIGNVASGVPNQGTTSSSSRGGGTTAEQSRRGPGPVAGGDDVARRGLLASGREGESTPPSVKSFGQALPGNGAASWWA